MFEYPNTLAIPETVMFMGTEYRLMGKRRYYLSQSTSHTGRKGAKGLHVAIWEHYNGKEVPQRHAVHHKDHNCFNNSPDNLECIPISKHSSEHSKKWIKENPEWFADFHRKGIEKAKEWHGSEEGRAWHKENGKLSWTKCKTTTKHCIICGEIFNTKWPAKAEVCSNKCNAKKWRQRNPERSKEIQKKSYRKRRGRLQSND